MRSYSRIAILIVSLSFLAHTGGAATLGQRWPEISRLPVQDQSCPTPLIFSGRVSELYPTVQQFNVDQGETFPVSMRFNAGPFTEFWDNNGGIFSYDNLRINDVIEVKYFANADVVRVVRLSQ